MPTATMKPAAQLPSVRGFKILAALARYHYLTASQLTWLLFRPTTHTTTQMTLTALTRAGYLSMDRFGNAKTSGAKHGVWTLTARGRSYLEAHGVDVPPRIHHKIAHADAFYQHVGLTNDILIALECAARAPDAFALERFVHDLSLRREAGRPIPDAWVEVQLDGRTGGLWVEADCSGSVKEGRWREKLAALRECYRSGRYEAAYGTPSLMVAVVCQPGAKRRDQLLAWTEAFLRAEGMAGWAATFRFTAADPGHISPQDFVHGQHWVRIGREATGLFAV